MSSVAPTYEEFIVSFPAFAEVTEVTVSNAIDFSTRFLSQLSWAEFYSDAVGLDAAHALALDAMAGSGASGGVQAAVGVLSSVSAAGVSTSFGMFDVTPGSKSDAWYSKTIYGQKFLRLRDNCMSMGSMCS